MRTESIIDLLAATVETMGAEMGPMAMEMIAEGLASFPDTVIKKALQRCAMEIRGKDGYPPRLALADILDRCGVLNEADAEKADGILAWEEAQRIAKRHAQRDPVSGRWSLCTALGPIKQRENGTFYTNPIPVPELAQRVLDTVHRIGGWGVIKVASEAENRHGDKTEVFTKRDFLAAYAEWTKIEQRREATGGPRLALGSGEGLARLEASIHDE